MFPKELWIENIIAPLKEIASSEFQEKGWVKGEIHPYCRLADTICRLFDDAYFEKFIDQYAKNLGFSDEVIHTLDIIRNALNAYVDKHGCYEDAENVINDPEWHRIRKMAKEALNSLGIVHYLDPSKSIFKSGLLYCIDYIRDVETQRRVWVKGKRPNTNPFSELMERICSVGLARPTV